MEEPLREKSSGSMSEMELVGYVEDLREYLNGNYRSGANSYW